MFSENVALKEFTTMKTGGTARYFFVAKNVEDIKEAIVFAKEKNLPVVILGGGSNTIAPDEGFSGVVIKIKILGVVFEKEKNNVVKVTAGAGVEWDTLVKESVDIGLYGLENLSSIPGTVGASPVQNIGAYGAEVKDTVSQVEVFDIDNILIKKIPNKECLFGYRDSLFKSKRGKSLVVLNVVFELNEKGELDTKYKDVEKFFRENNITLTLKTLRSAIIEIRASKLPDIKKVGTAGSFFKNPVVSEKTMEKLLKKYSNISYFATSDNQFKLSAAWLLDKVGGWNGVCVGDVCVYKQQPLVLVNLGNATTKEILLLADKIQKNIKQKTGVELELEVSILSPVLKK